VVDPSPFSVFGQDAIFANGIFADTGRPLCEWDVARLAQIARAHALPRHEQHYAQTKYYAATQPYCGTIGGVKPDDLAQAGWGIIFPARIDDAIKQALQPLIAHRRRQAGDLCRVFENAEGYQPGESCAEWLARHRVEAYMPVDPHKGVPFYLLLIGSPEEIPFEFQYELDIFWAVGRLHFEQPDDYRRYAESVAAYEQAIKLPNSRRVAIFATAHEQDNATQMFAKYVAEPLAQGEGEHGPLGAKQNFHLNAILGANAKKEALTRIVQGHDAGGPPALLFSGTHGLGFQPDDPRLPVMQGALVCQDWPGKGSLKSAHSFSAHDLPADARVHGLIHFCFACYSAGCPQCDDFIKPPHAQPERIAPQAMIARLPQKLLAHPEGGALAVLGHVDRAWSYSFYSSHAGPQLQSFRDVMTRLLEGERVGLATDQFDVRRAALSFALANQQRDLSYGKQIPDHEVASLWAARNDARNYIVLGDPAVRLRVEDLKAGP